MINKSNFIISYALNSESSFLCNVKLLLTFYSHQRILTLKLQLKVVNVFNIVISSDMHSIYTSCAYARLNLRINDENFRYLLIVYQFEQSFFLILSLFCQKKLYILKINIFEKKKNIQILLCVLCMYLQVLLAYLQCYAT